MNVVLVWVCDGSVPAQRLTQARARFDAAAAEVVEPTFTRHSAGGDDWGLTVLHPSASAPYRWSAVAEDGGVTAVSVGIPVGPDLTGGPTGLARRLLAGADFATEVVPPFGLIAIEDGQRIAIGQDWLGMSRLFTGEADGVTAWCTRPSLLATFLTGSVRPDLDGWTSYAATGFFGGDLAPVAGTRLLAPGARVAAQRRAGGGWQLTYGTGGTADDLVTAGLAARDRGLDGALDLAAEGLTNTMARMGELNADAMVLGLSGGKDSRLLAAAAIAAGQLPAFRTNDDIPAEGEVARELVEILREARGLKPEHTVGKVGAPARVLAAGLIERARRLQRRYDFQFPSSYLTRAAVPPRLSDSIVPLSLSGIGGEIATGHWYAVPRPEEAERQTVDRALRARLMCMVVPEAVGGAVATREWERVAQRIEHAAGLGLRGMEIVNYVYLMESTRRWYSSAYTLGTVTPYLSPAFVSASFAALPEHKLAKQLHGYLLRRLLPEWADVRYVHGSAGSTNPSIWDGDGLAAVGELLDTTHGELAGLVPGEAVRQALRRCVAGAPRGYDARTLQIFTYLAVASQTLEPAAVRAASRRTYDEMVAQQRWESSRTYRALKVVRRMRRRVRRRLGRALRRGRPGAGR